MSLLCSLPLAAQLFGACAPAAPLAVGYVEGDYVLLAPIEVAQVETVAVKRGDRVSPDATVV
ncbi:HlyD family secretion protein, partial [Mesorhizobium sp. M4B.F.Ca.ET.089.01.1.1]